MTDRIEATDPFTLSDTAATALLREVPWRRFAVIGDSTAAGTGDPRPGYETLPWADRLARWLLAAHPGSDYLNTGVMGAVLAEVRTRQLPALEAFGPDLVHLTCGGNDLFLRDARLEQVEADLDDLCARVAATGARLSLFTLADSFTGRMAPLRPRFAGFAAAVRRVAHRHDAILTAFWDHPARTCPDWLSADRIHLTMAGHAVVAAEIARNLARDHTTGTQTPDLMRSL
ncbi:SGNH/GDSL hydrolase family protein [Nocardia seriolae]|uniref:Hydrolase GDSL n=1 Tax=Nocardia seriolae TaxID=37332 RepID=A0A0B8N771_9NOCA|nr:SGNH/GDSL hydrolase family protein [Nocardia seriolae]MTJ63913.1 SGNH/GDSL hydrolase family protein [Nocardia seriolae]MTJ71037.1 SGNH/GDSL hydrolase family protein [Nocardia seriolae]MTJ88640.1 SGNH/GDSL hydrolase family protein [Nocardia seriolae]MTK32620.1 SGNH/GDSL hydrolase family protein [Nocardia seriolae]MTK41804.1 SGNH/GDSL hydrolase family protein [Nocardia seriolae]